MTINLFESNEGILVDSFEHLLLKIHGNTHTIALRELDCWQGRADLVVAKMKTQYQISQEGLELLNRLGHATILALLHKKRPLTFATIASKSGLSLSTLKKYLNELKQANVVQISETGGYLLHSDILLPQIEFHAYEAKLRDWRRALYQAINYYGFAQYSSVVMPERFIKPALENLWTFEANGVGLLSYSFDGLKIHLKPKRNRPRKRSFHLVGIGRVLKLLSN